MKLQQLVLRNVGPIENFDLTLPFNRDGTPKPLIIVGSNGSGKTILLSTIVDGLIEFAKPAFRDTVQSQGNLSLYFRIVGSTNQRIGSESSVSVLDFSNGSTHLYLSEKTGKLSEHDVQELHARFTDQLHLSRDEDNKATIIPDAKYVEDFFQGNTVCYFPPNRHEKPHWLNDTSIESVPVFYLASRLKGVLNKPLVVESAAEDNKQWILDVILDSLVNVEQNVEGLRIKDDANGKLNLHLTDTHLGAYDLRIRDNWNEKLLLQQSRRNVDAILQKVLKDTSLQLMINYRSISPYRLSISRAGQVVIPTLDHLSSGQSILFNMFATLVRYSDRSDLNKSIRLQEIEGIVLIDEIDAHLHSDLQYELLPELIALFPKVQFVVTTHAPLFLLGMEKHFGRDGIEIIEMPTGQAITTERFSEFQRSFDYYTQTKAYEDGLAAKLIAGSRPLVFTEGDTDPVYIMAALHLLGRDDLAEALNIEWIGAQREGTAGPFNTGDSALNHAKDFIEANPDFTKHQKIMLLYDWDVRHQDQTIGRLYVRTIPKNEANILIKKGIENLLPIELFEDQFYVMKEVPGDYGRPKVLPDFKKREFCDWVCKQRNSPDDFKAFAPLITILEELL